MRVTCLGHACVNVDIGDALFLVDPFISPNPPVKRVGINSIKVDYILITHAHAGHIVDVGATVKRTGTQLATNPRTLTHFEAFDLSGHSMNLSDSYRFIDGKAKIKVIKTEHSSSFPDSSYGGNPASFLIDYNGGTIYIASDTALRYDMKIIPRQYRVNPSIFSIGNNYTMGICDVLAAVRFVQANNVLGVHYDTLPVIEINKESFRQKFKDDRRRPHLTEIGAILNLKGLNIYTL